jgi:tetratricopeptide (TPR) repeat protein
VAPDDPVAEAAATDAELGELDSLERRILVYASAMGREFDFRLLVTAMEAEEEPLVEAVERLVARGILRERAGGDRFIFTDDARRGQIYRTLTQSRLRVVHRRIAQAMEQGGVPVPAEIVAELGRHFFLGRVPEKSYAYNLEAADRAEQDGLPEIAALHLERARIDRSSVAGLDPGVESRLTERLGHLYYALGDLRAASRLFSEGLEGSDPQDPRRQAGLWISGARVARDLRDPESAVAGIRKAQTLYESIDDVAGLATVHRSLARISFDRGRYQEALEEGMLALDLLRSTDDHRTLGALSIDLGNAFRRLSPELHTEAVEWYDRAIDHLLKARDDVALAEAYLERGREISASRPTEALEDLAKSRQVAERAHDPIAAASALLEAVLPRLLLGQTDEAERDNQLAENLLEHLDAPRALERARLNTGFLRERRGRWEEAETAYLDAVDRAQRLQDDGALAEAQFCLARLYLKTHDLPQAKARYLEAARLRLPVVRPDLTEVFEDLGRDIEQEGAPGPETVP